MSIEPPVILSAVRTPIGKFQGGLAGFSAPELGGKAVAEAIRRSGLEAKQIDEAILGNVVQAGVGQKTARAGALQGRRRGRRWGVTPHKELRCRPQSLALGGAGGRPWWKGKL